MSGHGLTPRQRRAVELLAAGLSYREAASELGIGEATLRRWRKKPLFAAALREAEKQIWDATIRKLRALGERAVHALGKALDDPDGTPSSRIAAAKTILEMSAKAEIFARLEDLENRLARLEGKRVGTPPR